MLTSLALNCRTKMFLQFCEQYFVEDFILCFANTFEIILLYFFRIQVSKVKLKVHNTIFNC